MRVFFSTSPWTYKIYWLLLFKWDTKIITILYKNCMYTNSFILLSVYKFYSDSEIVAITKNNTIILYCIFISLNAMWRLYSWWRYFLFFMCLFNFLNTRLYLFTHQFKDETKMCSCNLLLRESDLLHIHTDWWLVFRPCAAVVIMWSNQLFNKILIFVVYYFIKSLKMTVYITKMIESKL